MTQSVQGTGGQTVPRLWCAGRWALLAVGLIALGGAAPIDAAHKHAKHGHTGAATAHAPVHARALVRPAADIEPEPLGPEQLAALGRYVAIAPRCNVRDTNWGQRLDMALAQAMTDGGADQMSAQRDLASSELAAVNELKINAASICRSLGSPAAVAALRRADALVR